MLKTQGYLDPHKVITMCTWCGKKIPEDSGIFALGAKVKSNIDLRNKAGHAIQLHLLKCGKTVKAIVPTNDSQAKKEGKDLLFIICSQHCGNQLKRALQDEVDLFDQISYPSPN